MQDPPRVDDVPLTQPLEVRTIQPAGLFDRPMFGRWEVPPPQRLCARDTVMIEIDHMDASRTETDGRQRKEAAAGSGIEKGRAGDPVAAQHLRERSFRFADPALVEHLEKTRP